MTGTAEPAWSAAKKSTARGILWLSLLRVWDQVLNAVVTIVLARLLMPEVFGIVGMATIFIGLFALLSDLGTGKAIIQKQDLDQQVLSSLFWFNILIGLLVAGVVSLFSPAIENFFAQPGLRWYLCAMSGSYIIASFSVVQSALLQRQMQFNKVAIITAVGIMTGGVAGIISAISHLGVWSLVIQYLITCLISTLLYIIVSKWKPGFHFRWGDIRQVWGFSAFLTGFNLSNYSARNADNLIVGRMLGATSLGAYALAYRMMVYPISNLTSVIQQAVLPLFSRVQDEKEKLSRSFIKSSRYQAFLITPLMLGLAVMANEFILVFFGERWAAAVPVLAILCLVAVFQPYVMYFTVVLISKGLTKVLFYWSLTTTVVLIIAFLVSVQWGIVGVAVAYLIIQVIIAVASIPILFRMAGISVRHFLQQMTLPFFASVCMAAVVAVIRFILVTRTDIGTASCLLVGVLGGMVIYGTILFLFRRAFWNEMKGDVSMLFGRKPKVMEK